MVMCAIKGCGRVSGRHKGCSFFNIPAVITRQCTKTFELTSCRRKEWVSRINREGLTEDNVKDYTRICNLHFISGKPSYLFDVKNPDWAPSLNLGHNYKKVLKGSVTVAERRRRRKEKLKALAAQADEEAKKANLPLQDATAPHHTDKQTPEQAEARPMQVPTASLGCESVATASVSTHLQPLLLNDHGQPACRSPPFGPPKSDGEEESGDEKLEPMEEVTIKQEYEEPSDEEDPINDEWHYESENQINMQFVDIKKEFAEEQSEFGLVGQSGLETCYNPLEDPLTENQERVGAASDEERDEVARNHPPQGEDR